MTVGVVASRSKEDQFRSVYTRTFPSIVSYVRRRVTPGDSSELDVTSEIFAVVWRRLDDLPPPPDDLLWIYGVARNCVARFHRDESRRMRLRTRVTSEPVARPESDRAEETYEVVREAVARLPETDREAIRLVHWEGLHHEEVATVLGLTPNAVELRLRRARARLRRDLAALLPEDVDVDVDVDVDDVKPHPRSHPIEGIE